jgi:signal transduction histidine kinase
MVDAATEQLVVATDDDGRIVASSPGAHELLGCDASVLAGGRVTDFYESAELRAAADRAGLGSSPADLLRVVVGRAEEGFPERHDWTLVRPDGSRVPVDVAVTRRPRLDGHRTAGYLFVGNDLTERRESERLQDEFIGLVSHELRTPLASILGYVDLLRAGPDALSEEQARYLEVVERNAQRLLRLVNDLLLSVQLAAGTFQLTPERLDAAEVVRRSVTSLGPTAVAAGVTVDVDVPPSLPFVSDSVRLGQVTENLVANAVKFTPRGGHVRVTLRRGGDAVGGPARLHPRADDVRLMVVDDGPGITEAELARVTERFFRSRDARNRRVSGLGLGLPIVASIVAAHGGHMDIDSAPDEGTSVVVDLHPLVRGTET